MDAAEDVIRHLFFGSPLLVHAGVCTIIGLLTDGPPQDYPQRSSWRWTIWSTIFIKHFVGTLAFFAGFKFCQHFIGDMFTRPGMGWTLFPAWSFSAAPTFIILYVGVQHAQTIKQEASAHACALAVACGVVLCEALFVLVVVLMTL